MTGKPAAGWGDGAPRDREEDVTNLPATPWPGQGKGGKEQPRLWEIFVWA